MSFLGTGNKQAPVRDTTIRGAAAADGQVRRMLVIGSTGLARFHFTRLLLAEGFREHGFDGTAVYYNVDLKRWRDALCRLRMMDTVLYDLKSAMAPTDNDMRL